MLRPLEGWKPEYHAGQFMTFLFPAISGDKRRSYSISSSPALDEPLAVTVKRIPNGEFSRRIVGETRVGDTWLTTGVSGFFKLPQDPDAIPQYFFLMAGSGITPGYSLIKTLLAITKARIVLVYSNRSERDAIFLKQLRDLSEKHADRFKLHLLFSTSKDLVYSRMSNFRLIQIVEQYLEVNREDALFYVCGPLTYMQMVIISLIADGVPKENIRTESFDSTPRKFKNPPPAFTHAKVTIEIGGETYHFDVHPPDTILAAAKRNHIQMPYSCDTGRCGSCAARCVSGNVWMSYNEVLSEAELTKGMILTCTGYPANDNDIRLRFD